jgi:hypothetical protein
LKVSLKRKKQPRNSISRQSKMEKRQLWDF